MRACGREMAGKVEDVAHGRGAERIDRLRVVADHGEPAPVRLEREQDRGLQAVGVLIFVDQDMIEARADLGGECRLGQHVRPVEQQVVVIEHVLALLCLDVGGEQLLQFRRPVGAPGKGLAQHLFERRFRHSRRANRSRGTCPWWESGFRCATDPSSWRTRFIRSAASSRSWIVNERSSPMRSAYSRRNRAPIAWKVPDQTSPRRRVGPQRRD